MTAGAFGLGVLVQTGAEMLEENMAPAVAAMAMCGCKAAW